MRFALLILILTYSLVSAQLCSSWGAGETLGYLDPQALSETSGIIRSQLDPNRLYSMSDSGSPYFYVSDLTGSNLQEVRVGTLGNRSRDIEDLAVGPCGSSRCLFIGNIGGNNVTRDSVEIILVEERAEFPERVEPVQVLTLLYPDGPHDAEGLAVHPNGDIYLLTKETPSLLGVPAPKLYRARPAPWRPPDEPVALELIATLDLRSLSGSALDVLSHMATALDISSDGSRVLVLTYNDVIELELDLSTLTGPLRELGTDLPFHVVPVDRLIQQEALTYLPEQYGFIYTTEARDGESPLVKHTCADF